MNTYTPVYCSQAHILSPTQTHCSSSAILHGCVMPEDASPDLFDSCQSCFGSSVWILCQTSLLSTAVESLGGSRHCLRQAIWVRHHGTTPKQRRQIQAPYWDHATFAKTPIRVYLEAVRKHDLSRS